MSRLRADSFAWDGSANDPAGMVGDNRDWTDALNRDANWDTLPAIGQAKAVANSSTAEDAVSPSVRMSALSCGYAAERVVTTKAS